MIWTQLKTNVPLPRQGRRFAALLIFMLFCMEAAVDLCDARETGTKDSALGVLELEGKHVEQLVLRRRDGHTEGFTRPDETIQLPAGEYQLQEARLKGDYTCRSMGISGGSWVTVAVDKAAVFKVGAPLVPTLKLQRRGRILVMSYELHGAGGEAYTGGDRSKPPTFAVYKGQKKIASDKFEFG
jgi:hypothetical protein